MPGKRGERAGQDLIERACTRCRALICKQVASDGIRLNDMLANAQFRGECVDGHLVRVGEDRYSLIVDEASSDEEWGDRLSLQRDDGHVIVFGVPFY